MVVLDASVMLKWFYPPESEPDAEIALQLLERCLDGGLTIVVPSFAMYEVASSMRHSAYRLDSLTVRAYIAHLFRLGLTVVPVTRGLLWSAVEMAFAHDVAVYDAYYFATARHTDSACVTADRRAYRHVESLPWVHFLGDIRDAGAFDDRAP